jgi:hypothetical protein
VGPRVGLDAVVKRKFPAPAGTQPPIIQPVAQRYIRTERQVSHYAFILFTLYRESVTRTTTTSFQRRPRFTQVRRKTRTQVRRISKASCLTETRYHFRVQRHVLGTAHRKCSQIDLRQSSRSPMQLLPEPLLAEG